MCTTGAGAAARRDARTRVSRVCAGGGGVRAAVRLRARCKRPRNRPGK